MSNEELRIQARRASPHIKIAGALWLLGIMTVMAAAVTWVVISLGWSNDYYAIGKAVRDAAEPGSGVLATLASIQTTKAWVLPLQVLGLSTFLLGFGFAFANILQNVRLRGNTMAAVLPILLERKRRPSQGSPASHT